MDCIEFIVLFRGGPVEFLGGVLGTSHPRANTGVSGKLADVCRGPRPAAIASRFCLCNVRLLAPLALISESNINLEDCISTHARNNIASQCLTNS
jgi:hypothetical protein